MKKSTWVDGKYLVITERCMAVKENNFKKWAEGDDYSSWTSSSHGTKGNS